MFAQEEVEGLDRGRKKGRRRQVKLSRMMKNFFNTLPQWLVIGEKKNDVSMSNQ